MIWDCFLYNQEEECLQLRMKELQGLEIIHVAVQSDRTFTGNPKQVTNLFNVPSVIQVHVTDMPDNCDAWTRETHQRNAIMRGLKYAKDDDIVIISDVDEIPSRAAVESYKPEMGLTALKMDVYWYKFNCLAEKQTWIAPKILTYAELKKSSPNEVRGSGFPSVIDNAGWHFSYMGDSDYIVNKLESFSHVEYNQEPFKDKNEITRKMNEGIALWGDGKFEFVPLDDTFPKYLYENQHLFKNLIQKL